MPFLTFSVPHPPTNSLCSTRPTYYSPFNPASFNRIQQSPTPQTQFTSMPKTCNCLKISTYQLPAILFISFIFITNSPQSQFYCLEVFESEVLLVLQDKHEWTTKMDQITGDPNHSSRHRNS